MKVLWVTERFPPDRGGAAISAARQVRSLAGYVDEIAVLRLSASLGPARVAVEEHGGATVYRVGEASGSDESLQILSQTAFNLARAHRYDLVHGFYAVHAGYVAATAARLLGIPSAVSLRGNDLDRALFHGPRLPFLLWTLDHADALLGVSKEILGKVSALTGRTADLHHVPNAVNAAVFSPGEADGELAALPRPFVAFSGEARLKKGLPILLDLAALMATERRGTLFLIGGMRREERQAMAAWRQRSPAAAERLREIPYRDDPAALARVYRGIDLFVFPSLWEGMPNALLEAMACGKPALATAIGACPELISHGETGFLLDPSRLDEFPREALALCDRPAEVLARVGAAARERVLRHFTLEAERDAILAVYRGLAS